MADVMKYPGVLEQVWLVGKVRWCILRNSMRQKNRRWDLIGMVLAGIFSFLLVAGLCAAFYAGAYTFLKHGKAQMLALFFWGIFLFWQLFPIIAAGFGSNFEFRSVLRYPLSMRAFYLLGIGYGLTDFVAVASICWLASMLAGATRARIDVVPALLVVSLLFILLNVTLERLLASWLEKILAKRRTREIFLGLFVLLMVSTNFIAPALQQYGKAAQPQFAQFVKYIWALPGSLAGAAVSAAAQGQPLGFVSGLAGLLVWTLVLSTLLWSRFRVQYLGEELGESGAPTATSRKERREAAVTDAWGDYVRGPVGAVALKEVRYMTRNGFAFLMLLLPPLLVLFFSFQFTGAHSPLKSHTLKPDAFFPAMMAYLMLILLSPAYNSFAYEGKGIQMFYLAPVHFRDVMMGKNLYMGALVVFEMALSMAILGWRVGWPHPATLIATIMAVVFAVTGQLTIANWSSLSFPKKMEFGKMQGQRNSGVAVWTAFGVQIVLGGVCAAVLFGGNALGGPWAPAIAFTGLSLAAVGGYRASLKGLDQLAITKRETLIETLCK